MTLRYRILVEKEKANSDLHLRKLYSGEPSFLSLGLLDFAVPEIHPERESEQHTHNQQWPMYVNLSVSTTVLPLW